MGGGNRDWEGGERDVKMEAVFLYSVPKAPAQINAAALEIAEARSLWKGPPMVLTRKGHSSCAGAGLGVRSLGV